MTQMLRRTTLVLITLTLLSACISRPPVQPNNLCAIFLENPGWYRVAKKSADKWGGNISVPMAIMYQESTFKARAKPPYRFFLGVIPRGRASNAYGYAQALNGTWSRYQHEAGSRLSRRSHFGDSFDFIQWYMHTTHNANGVAVTDAYRQYLNYHEGQGGYARGTYKSKDWLIAVAKKVADRAKRYSNQLTQCSARLERKRRWLI